MPGDENAGGAETNEEPTTSTTISQEDGGPAQQPPSDSNPEEVQQQKRGEDADRYAASVAEVAAGGGGKKDGVPAPPGAPPVTPQVAQSPSIPPLAQQQAPPGPPGPPGPPQHHAPPNSFAPPPGMPPMDWRPPPPGSEHHGYYPPYGMPPRHHPGYPPPPPHAYGYPPQGAYYPPPPHMMRPQGPNELVRMPPGPTPTEWAAQQQQAAQRAQQQQQQQKDGTNGNPATPSSCSQPIPSPSASSIAEESLDEKPPGTKMPPPPQQPPHPQQQQMMSPMPPGGPPLPQTPANSTLAATPATPASEAPKVSGKVLSRQELLEKLVGPVSAHNPPNVMPERRMFFDRLIEFCERNGDPITMVPQVSKQTIDLHRLYIGVRGKGGFQAVTKEKLWKNLCGEANPDLAESSAAGYQLRKHYQRHLLMLECRETGKNPDDEVAFADRMKRQRKREPQGGAAAAAVAAAAAAGQGDQKAGGSGGPAQPPGGPAAYPGNGAPPGAAPYPGPPPHMDPNYHYYQQHGMMPPPHPGYPPQHMNAFSPGQYAGHQRPPPPGAPGAPGAPPGVQMRPPMPPPSQHQMPPPHELDDQQRAWYAQQQAAAAHHAQHQAHMAAQAHAAQQAAAQQQQQQQQQQQAATAPPSTTPAPPTAASETNTQPATPSASNQPPTPAGGEGTQPAQTPTPTPAGVSAPSSNLKVDSTEEAAKSQAGSRAPSAGPAATPDSTSRLSGGADGETPEPGSSTPAPPEASTSATPTAPGAPQGAPGPQGPPGPYPYPYMRPPTGFAPPPGAYGGYPPGPPPPGAYHPASHPQHPQHQHYLAWQQRYHQQQQQQAAQAQAQQGGAPPGGPRPPYPVYPPGPAGRMVPPTGQQGAPSPGAGKRYGTPAPPAARPGAPTPQPIVASLPVPQQQPQQQPSTSSQSSYLASTLAATPVQPPQAAPTAQAPSQMIGGQQQHQFPPGSIEATAAAQSQVKRRKVFARELINATPRRLIMALRSGLDAEAVWAINALNVLLYDDNNPQPSLQQMPGLVNVIVEHLFAVLSILFPAEFKLNEPGKPIILDESKEIVEKVLNGGKAQNGSLRTLVEKMPVVPRKGSDKNATFTMQSRNGLQVHFRDENLPASLRKRVTREHTEQTKTTDESITSTYVGERNAVGLGGGLAERIATRLRDKIVHEKTRPRPVFSKYLDDKEEVEERLRAIKVEEVEEVEEKTPEDVLLIRGARPDELSDCKHEVELAWPRPTALSPRSLAVEELAQRALALSNILRGFSFVPGSDQLMARNEALLFIVGRFLKLNVNERKISTKRPGVVLDVEELKKEPQELSNEEKQAKEKAVLDEVDATTSQMIETASQLRDDAFVMLTHMSVSLNLFDLSDAIAYPIYDGLLRWAVSRVPEATDSTVPAPVSPRDYSLEIMCKMVVIERNVDMLLSTGSWSRVEQFVHILSRLLTMNEETHYREFAIVILNALCVASEAVCYICSMETSTIAHLILFIDSADQSMHQVMQTHGMNALRDNPELMGTSVGMLRRAASMLRLLVKVPKAYKVFQKHQTRLLQFTMSQLMDSRVAGMVADTLFEIQEYVKEFGEDVPEPLKITYSEGYQPDLEEEKRKEEEEEARRQSSEGSTSEDVRTTTPSTSSSQQQTDEKRKEATRTLDTTEEVEENGVATSSGRSSTSLNNKEVEASTSSANNHRNEEENEREEEVEEDEEEEKKEMTEEESCDGFESTQLRISTQKRSAAALIDEQSRSPPPAKRTCLTNGFDKANKTSVSTNGSLSESSQNDGALTTAVA